MAFIFDLDGVIIHSTPVHTEAWEEYLGRFGIPRERVAGRMLGLRNDEIVKDFFGEQLSEEEVQAHGAAKERLYREMMAPRLGEFVVPGLLEFLERHRWRPMGVASNAERRNIDFVLDRAGIREFFRVIVDGHQAVRPKPFPDIYRMTAGLLGVEPTDCIVFEDSVAGIEAARAAGARVVGLMTTLKEPPGVEIAIESFLDSRLEPWLHRQHPH